MAGTARTSRVALIGRREKTVGSPLEMTMARSRYSSIKGLRIKAGHPYRAPAFLF